MKTELSSFLHMLQGYQHQIVMDYFFLSILIWLFLVKSRSVALCATLINISVTFSILAAFAYLLAIALSLRNPNYHEHMQATVVSISWLWMQGHELYPDWTVGKIYGLMYGPVLFLINGVTLFLSPPIFGSKLPGVLSLGATLGATWMLLAWKTASRVTSLILLASLIMLFAPFDVIAYWNRAESFLILVNVLALLLAFRSSSVIAWLGIGVLAGVATGLKIYGFLYMIPATAAAFARLEVSRARLMMSIIVSASAIAVTLLPFLQKGVSIFGYLRFLRVAIDEGLLASQFIENVEFAVILMAPVLMIWIWRKPVLHPSDRWLLAALGPSIALVTVIGAKDGGGTHYLLPFVPVCIYAIATVCASAKAETEKIASLVFISYFLAYSPNLVLNVRDLYHDTTAEREKIAELKTYLDSYPGAQIGVSDDEHYSSYFYRVLSVWDRRPLDVDFSTWMDLAYIGVDEGYIVRFIERCTIPVWILPLGRPFTKTNDFNGQPLLSERFRQTFLTNYRQIETGHAYQVWACRS